LTSLLGRLLPLFVGARRVEDLFTEAVACLFERRPELCLSWLDELELTAPVSSEDQGHISVSTQKSFVALEEHGSGSRPDLIVEVHHPAEDDEPESPRDIVMIESKIGSWEGQEQLRRYAEHLDRMTGTRKTLVYITRAYDPKSEEKILAGTRNANFRQLRWRDFYKFLQKSKKDALVEEVMLFMEEQGMSRSHRLSTNDLMAMSGVPRAFEIFDETLGDEVKTELESFAGNKIMREGQSIWEIRNHRRYFALGPLHGWDLFCAVGHQLGKVDDSGHASILRIPADGYPAVFALLEARPEAVGRETSVAAMKKIAFNVDWEPYNLENPSGHAGVRRFRNFADLLPEEDHIFAIKQFFIESIRELREELTEFKKENPELPWNGGS